MLVLAKDFMSLSFGGRIWGGSVSWGEGRGRQEWTPQHRGVVQPGYDWPGQDVGLLAVGLGREWEGGRGGRKGL